MRCFSNSIFFERAPDQFGDFELIADRLKYDFIYWNKSALYVIREYRYNKRLLAILGFLCLVIKRDENRIDREKRNRFYKFRYLHLGHLFTSNFYPGPNHANDNWGIAWRTLRVVGRGEGYGNLKNFQRFSQKSCEYCNISSKFSKKRSFYEQN